MDPISIFFERELEKVSTKLYDKRFPEFKARVICPPIDEGPADYDMSYTWREFEPVGIARLISDYSKNLPRADMAGEEHTTPIKTVGSSFAYNVDELRASQAVGRPVDQGRGNSAKRAIEFEVDDIIASGRSAVGVSGFINNSAVPVISVAAGDGGDTTWATKTLNTNGDAEILADLNLMVSTMRDLTNGVESPTDIVLPEAQYTLIAQRRVSDTQTTILEYFLTSNPWIQRVMPWHKLKAAGATSKDRAICFRRDPDVVSYIVSREFTMEPPQPNGLEFEVPCHSRVGGVVVRYPLAMEYMDGL